MPNAGLLHYPGQQQALSTTAPAGTQFIRSPMYTPYQQPQVIGLHPNQYALYQQHLLGHQQQIPQQINPMNLSNPAVVAGMPIQSPMPVSTGLVANSQVAYPVPAQPKTLPAAKKVSKAIKIVDPNTGTEVKVGKAKTDSSPPPVSSAPPTVPQGGLLPDPKMNAQRPEIAQTFITKVHSTMNRSSPVFVPGQPLAQEFRPVRVVQPPPVTEFRPNAIIRRPDEVKTGEGEAPVINGGGVEKTKEEIVSAEPTTPLEPPPTELMVPLAEEPLVKPPPTVPVEAPPTPGTDCSVEMTSIIVR